MRSESCVLVVTTFPDIETARDIAKILVEERLVACVNLIPQMESIYLWKEGIHNSHEVGGLMKTMESRVSVLETRLCQLHPYELPELIVLPVKGGLPAFLDWVSASVKREG